MSCLWCLKCSAHISETDHAFHLRFVAHGRVLFLICPGNRQGVERNKPLPGQGPGPAGVPGGDGSDQPAAHQGAFGADAPAGRQKPTQEGTPGGIGPGAGGAGGGVAGSPGMDIGLGMPPAGHVSPMTGNMGGAGGGMGMGRGGPGMGVGMRGPQVGPGGPGGGPGVGGMGGMPGNMGRGGPGGNQPNQFVPQNMASTEQAREHAMRQMQYLHAHQAMMMNNMGMGGNNMPMNPMMIQQQMMRAQQMAQMSGGMGPGPGTGAGVGVGVGGEATEPGGQMGNAAEQQQAPPEPPKPREKKLLFSFDKETKEVKTDAEAVAAAVAAAAKKEDVEKAQTRKVEAAAAVPAPAAPPASSASTHAPGSVKPTPAGAAAPKLAEGPAIAKTAESSGTGALNRDAQRRDQATTAPHGKAEGKAEVASAGLAPSADHGAEAEKKSAPMSRGNASKGVATSAPAATSTQAVAAAAGPAPAAAAQQRPNERAQGRGAGAEKAAAPAAQDKVPGKTGAASAALPHQEPVAPKAQPPQPKPDVAKAPAPQQETSKLNGEDAHSKPATHTATAAAEPKVSASAKKEVGNEESAKHKAAPVPDKNVEPSPVKMEKELPRAADTAKSAEPTATARPAESPAAKPIHSEAPKAAAAAESAAPSKKPSEPKPRPVLKDGERLQYDIEFILKFKSLCKEAPNAEAVRNQVAIAGMLGADKGGPARSGMMPGGGGFGQAGVLGARASGQMPMGRDRGADPRGRNGRGSGPLMPTDRGSLRVPGSKGAPGYQMISGPIAPLQRSENGFDPSKNRAQTHYDAIMKEARSVLNKLTMTNFPKLSDQLAHMEIQDTEELRGLVSIIFDKALEEGHFCTMYAQLCNDIKDRMPEFQDEADPALGETKVRKVTFKRCLLNKCQEEFERADRYDEMNDEETAGLDAAAKANKTRRVRVRMLGNVKFIGELFAQKILNEKIMHDCVKRLLASKEEDTIECLCKLMATIGKLLDREEAKHYMDYYFDQMKQTANEIGSNPTAFPSGQRLKFMIYDTIDLRRDRSVLGIEVAKDYELYSSSEPRIIDVLEPLVCLRRMTVDFWSCVSFRWKPRREATGPKTIEQIRIEAAKEGLIAGPVPPPRGGPMMDPRGGHPGGMRGGGPPMSDPRDRRMGPSVGGPQGGQHGRPDIGGRDPRGMMDDRMGRNMGSGRPVGGGGGDGRDRPGGPGGPSGRSGAGGGAQGAAAQQPAEPAKPVEPPKPKLTLDQMEKRITSTLEEYVEIKVLEEVVETLKELPESSAHECLPFVNFKAVEMCCDAPKHQESLVKLLGALFEQKTLWSNHLEAGMQRFLECLEDVSIDVPSAPKVVCGFLIHGIKDKYFTWNFIKKMTDKYIEDKPKFAGTLLNALFQELGPADAPKAWRESGISLVDLGVKDESAFCKENKLNRLFPSEQIGELMEELLEKGASDADMIAQIEKTAGELECTVDRDMARVLMRCVLKRIVAELGGAEQLHKSDGESLTEPHEKLAFEKRTKLLKQWLGKECDQAYALFEVQKCAQQLDYPKGFLTRMLFTLYDLEVIEETAVRDWLSPPDNRHLFLKQAKDTFAIKNNVEAKKQVCILCVLLAFCWFVVLTRVSLASCRPRNSSSGWMLKESKLCRTVVLKASVF